jgi:nitroreductase
MSIIETIRQRKSVRTFSNQLIAPEIQEDIIHFIEELKIPFDAKVRICLINTQKGDEQRKLGTYGVVKGASHFLVLIYEEGKMTEFGAAYAFEQVILYCTQLGLGTCWIGGTFKRQDFMERFPIGANEQLRVISPLGYQREKKSMLDTLMKAVAKSAKRNFFETMFFYGDFSVPLSEDRAGEYKLPLEMVRLAPSARNSQPWRVVKDGEQCHFYYHPDLTRFGKIDMGIALCHFEISCRELNIQGKYEVLPEMADKFGNTLFDYAVSWVKD